MARTVYKFPFSYTGKVVGINVQGLIRILSVGEQNDELCMWCMVETSGKGIKTVDIEIVPTGEPAQSVALHHENYVGTVHRRATGFVQHIFARAS